MGKFKTLEQAILEGGLFALGTREFDFEDVPAAAAANKGFVIFVNDGDEGDPCLAVSDGTEWKVVALGAEIDDTPAGNGNG
jgi:predicted RNA-binding protein with TRAM domain